MEHLLRVEHVTKRFADHTALDDVSVSVPRGAVYGLLGPNGAGKTTLIRVVNRITAPDSGRIFLGDKEITTEDVRRIGYLPEERGLYKKMKVGEQALFFARLKGLPKHEATRSLREWFERFDILDWWDKKVEELSKGMAQKIQFIITVLHRPKLLIFDEPFSGFDPINAELLKNEILRLKEEGATVIFSTHNMASVEEVCDHITLINKSKNILSGRVDDIRHRHGNNIFQLDYRGEESALRRVLEGCCEVLEGSVEASVYNSLKIHVPTDGEVRGVLAKANEAVELRSFREIIPSMNDIFIRAVQGTL